jgi:hypothetical protein
MKAKTAIWIENPSGLSACNGEAPADESVLTAGNAVPMPYRPEGKFHVHYPKELKLRVTLEALREKMPQCEIGALYSVPQPLISIWKKAAIETIRDNIHYKPRKRRANPLAGEESAPGERPAPGESLDSVQYLCSILRGAAQQLENDPAALQQLIRSDLAS